MSNVALRGAQTAEIVSAEQGRRFYHSCQLRDLETYLQAGAIVCRDALIARGPQAGTPYETDAINRERGVLGHVFGNLGDNAWAYRFLLGVPDIYGPIHLEFDPSALDEFALVTIRRHGISAPDPGVVGVEDDVANLYHPALPDRLRGHVKGEVEGHASQLSFVRLQRIVVLPIVHANAELLELVTRLVEGKLRSDGEGPLIVARDASPGHLAKLVEWAQASSSHGWEHDAFPPFIALWLQEIAEHHRAREMPFERDVFIAKLRRFARCLEHGTLSRMRGEAGFLTFNR